MRRRISLLSFLIPLLILWAGCGKKAPPVSLDRIVPKVVSDLEASVREGRVI
ncbi:MAG: hypothetical protein GTO13_03340, partial [Proteobacteria bacterium]|nr:hypothetical protein [Pseudomonadota bacterium]